MKKTIKNPDKLTKVLNSLQPMSARLMFHFLLTRKAKKPFPYTLFDMGVRGEVKNPQRAIADILDKKYMTRERTSLGGGCYIYTLHVDLIE